MINLSVLVLEIKFTLSSCSKKDRIMIRSPEEVVGVSVTPGEVLKPGHGQVVDYILFGIYAERPEDMTRMGG